MSAPRAHPHHPPCAKKKNCGTEPEKDPELLDWNATQGHILTGGGRLNKYFVEGRDYTAPDDLPHYLKSAGLTEKTYKSWKDHGWRTESLVGAWRRPLFCGGWKESTEADTQVFNLQTPSLFIDIRFPIKRPDYSRHGGFYCLTIDQLRSLARQHTFAGYTKIDPKGGNSNKPIATRHHCLDWNYHPKFPRARPNRWRVELKKDGTSFKEFSVAHGDHKQAIYMERWQLYPDGKGPYLALRKCLTKKDDRESLLIVVGNHFAFARDRAHPLPSFGDLPAGGCANLVDAAYKMGDRKKMEHMLDLEGSHGKVRDPSGRVTWQISHSTLPWRQREQLIKKGDVVWSSNSSVNMNGVPTHVSIFESKWEVFECSFTKSQLDEMFISSCTKSDEIRSRL